MIARPVFHQLEPPLSRGRITVVQMPLDAEPKVARDAVYLWADDAWTAWAVHHSTVRDWVDRSGLAKD